MISSLCSCLLSLSPTSSPFTLFIFQIFNLYSCFHYFLYKVLKTKQNIISRILKSKLFSKTKSINMPYSFPKKVKKLFINIWMNIDDNYCGMDNYKQGWHKGKINRPQSLYYTHQWKNYLLLIYLQK